MARRGEVALNGFGGVGFGPISVSTRGRVSIPSLVPPTPLPALNDLETISNSMFGLPNPNLDDVVARQLAAQASSPITPVIDYAAMTPEAQARFAARAEQLHNEHPDLNGSQIVSIASSGGELEEMVRSLSINPEPRPWWKHLGSHVGRSFHSVFVAAPEWLWKNTIVDAFQEFAEVSGIPAEMAQKLSPGQIATVWMDVLAPGVWGTYENGQFVEPEDWADGARWFAGGIDIVARLTMDPTIIASKFRAVRALPLGLNKLLRVERQVGTAAAARAQRLAQLAARDPEKARAAAKGLIAGERKLVNFLAGNLSSKDVIASALGHTRVQRFLEDAARFADDSLGTARLLEKYGMPVRGSAITPHHIEYIMQGARRRGTAGASDRLVDLLTGTFGDTSLAEIDEVVKRYGTIRHLRDTSADLERWYKGVRKTGEDRLMTVPTLAELKATPMIAKGAPTPGQFAQFGQEAADAGFDSYTDLLARVGDEFNTAAKEIGIAGRINGVHEAEQLLDGFRAAAPISPLGYLPSSKVKDILGFDHATIGEGFRKMLGNTPVAGRVVHRLSFEMLPHSSVVPEGDPNYWVQFQRLGKAFGLDPEETTQYIQRAVSAPSERALQTVSDEMVKSGYRRLGITDDQYAEFLRASGNQRRDLYAKVGNRVYHAPFLESQRWNVVHLADPNFLKMVTRYSNANGVNWPSLLERGGYRLHVTRIFDTFNNTMKRLWVSRPATGMRVALETQARAKAMGYSSAYSHPLTFLAIMTAPYSPKTADRMLGRTLKMSAWVRGFDEETRELISNTVARSTDLGMNQMLFEAGLLSTKTYARRQVLKVENVRKLKGAGAMNQYRLAQHKILVEDVLNDRLAVRILSEGEEAAKEWLGTLDGVNYMRRLGRKNADQHFSDMVHYLDDHAALDDAVRPKLLAGTLSPEDLIGKEAAEIVGSAVDNIGAFVDGEGLRLTLDKLTKRFLSNPEWLGRQVTYKFELWDDVMRRVERYDAQAARLGRPLVDRARIKTLIVGGVESGGEKTIEAAILRTARKETQAKLKHLFFDFQEQGRIADLFRFAFPFGNAYQEVLSRWAGILVERPYVAHNMAQAWKAAEDVPGFSYTDPATGERYFHVPVVSWLAKFAGLRVPNPITGMLDGVAMPFAFNLKGVNLITGYGLAPGMGPIVQIPVGWLTRNRPNFAEVRELIFPFGQGSLLEDIAPGWFKQLRAFVQADERNEDYARVVSELMMGRLYTLFSQIRDATASGNLAEVAELRRQVQQVDADDFQTQARTIFAIRAASSFAFPATIRERTPWTKIVSFYREIAEVDPRLADHLLVSQYGPEILTFVQGKTEAIKGRKGARPPTAKARNLYLSDPEYRELVDAYGDPAWDLFKELWTDKVDPDELDEQLRNGSRRRIPLPELKDAAEARVGWNMYFAMSDQIDKRLAERNLVNLNSKPATDLAALKAEYVRSLSIAFPAWAAERESSGQGRGRRHRDIVSLATLAGLESLASLETVQGLRAYFHLRAQLLDELRTRGMSSLQSNRALVIKRQWDSKIAQLVKQYPAFARIWGRYLERDDLRPLRPVYYGAGGRQQAGLTLSSGAFDVPFVPVEPDQEAS